MLANFFRIDAMRPVTDGKECKAARQAIHYVTRVYEDAGSVIETREHEGDFREW